MYRVKRVFFKTLVDEVQELEALSKDPGAVVHGKRYSYTPLHHSLFHDFRFIDVMFCQVDQKQMVSTNLFHC